MNAKPKTLCVDGACTVIEVVRSIVRQALVETKREYMTEAIARISRSFHVSDNAGEIWNLLEEDERDAILVEVDIAVGIAGMPIPVRPWAH